MDASQVAALREILASSGWLERTTEFARMLRVSTRHQGGLLLVGTPAEEPWHLAAHLSDEARYADIPELAPTLVRWRPPADAPPHLRIGVDRIQAARRGETLFVVTPEVAPVPLLERVDDARRAGTTILTLDQGDPELTGLAHDALVIGGPTTPLSFDGAQHLVSAAAGEPTTARSRPGLRARLNRFLDLVSGPNNPE